MPAINPARVWGPEHQLVLEVERIATATPMAREETIWRVFHVHATEYFSTLAWVLEQPEALAYDPNWVRWLQRRASDRADRRSATRLTHLPEEEA